MQRTSFHILGSKDLPPWELDLCVPAMGYITRTTNCNDSLHMLIITYRFYIIIILSFILKASTIKLYYDCIMTHCSSITNATCKINTLMSLIQKGHAIRVNNTLSGTSVLAFASSSSFTTGVWPKKLALEREVTPSCRGNGNVSTNPWKVTTASGYCSEQARSPRQESTVCGSAVWHFHDWLHGKCFLHSAVVLCMIRNWEYLYARSWQLNVFLQTVLPHTMIGHK